MWLLRRVFLVGVILLILSVAVVVIARGNRAPTRLQALGFDVCDGEPCWHGLKPRMAGTALHSRFPNMEKTGNLEDVEGVWTVGVQLSGVPSIIESISMDTDDITFPLPVTAGEIVARFGAPCRAFVASNNMHLIYPTLVVFFYMKPLPNPADTRLQANSPPHLFELSKDDFLGGCSRASPINTWHGFTSVDVYNARFRRALSTSARP